MSGEGMIEIRLGSPPEIDISAKPCGVKLPELPAPTPRYSREPSVPISDFGWPSCVSCT